MRRVSIYIALLMLCLGNARAQHKPHVLSQQDYRAQIKTAPERRLVELVKVIPGLKLDIRYATSNNFMHRVMYSAPRAFARAPVAEALKQIQAELKLKGLALKIYDAYRPYAVTVDFYNMAKDTNFVADPKFGSRHNRGCAIDLTLINLKTGKELNMPTPYDSFSAEAASDYAGTTGEQLTNRELLKAVMLAHGFAALRTEWWHFDFAGYLQYEFLDVPFGDL